MNINQITSGVHYVGVNDRTTHLFEGLWLVPLGVSYNAYVVLGHERTALIDTVDAEHAAELEGKVNAVLDGRKLDYIIVNHMEQDHSGALSHMHLSHPEAAIVGNAKTAGMLAGYYGINDVHTVADGDTIDLGGKTLQFHLTPMLHWPETMMTRLVATRCTVTTVPSSQNTACPSRTPSRNSTVLNSTTSAPPTDLYGTMRLPM